MPTLRRQMIPINRNTLPSVFGYKSPKPRVVKLTTAKYKWSVWKRGVSSVDNNAADPHRDKIKSVIVAIKGNLLFWPIECERNFFLKNKG